MKTARKFAFNKKGFVLPTLLLVTVVMLLLATTLLASGTRGLRVATHDQQADQALYAAEAGLVRAAQTFAADGAIASPFNGDLGSSASSYSVVAYENTGESEMQVPQGPVIPPQTVYLRSEGTSENGTRRVEGALFTIGLQAFKVGALGNYVNVTNSSFDAYNSGAGDYSPDTVQDDLPLLASNRTDGGTFAFDNANIAGDIFVGPGGDPDSQVSQTNSTIGDVTAMASAIDLEEIEVPQQDDDASRDGDPIDIPPIGDLQLVQVDSGGVYHFDDGDGMAFSIDPVELQEALSNGSTGPPFGLADDVGNAINGAPVIYGDDTDGPYVQINAPDGYPGHWLMLRPDGRSYYNNSDLGTPAEGTTTGDSLANLLFGGIPITGGGGSPTSVTNPSVLQPGFYDTVTLEDGWNGSLSNEGTYVIKDLVIGNGSTLALPADGRNATFYVTGSLTIAGPDALANDTMRAPRLKVFYTGSNSVQLLGGSRSYFTLVAPNADVTLDSANSGVRTQFFGALVGDNVTVNNASFHFDTATSGIGTGTMGSAVTLIHRHRL